MSPLAEIKPAYKVVTPSDVAELSLPSKGVVNKTQCNNFSDNMNNRTFGAKQPFWNASDL